MATRTFTAGTGFGTAGTNTLKMQLIFSDGQIWDAVGLNLETWVNAQITRYDISCTETATGSGIYSYTIPATLPPGTWTERPRFTDTGFLSSRTPFIWNGSTVTGSISGTRFITVGTFLQHMQVGARNAGISADFASNSPYSLNEAHLALQAACGDFIDRTHCTRQTNGIDLAISTNALDLSGVAAFHPERILKVWSVAVDTASTACTPSIDVVGYDEILRWRLENSSTSGAPTQVGFSSLTAAITDKTASEAFTVFFQWYPPIITFTAGDVSSDVASTVLNIPGDMAVQVARTKAILMLQENQPQQIKEGRIRTLTESYEALVARCMGRGNYGQKSFQRESSSVLRSRGWR